jgi:hypothetical protein
MALKIVETPYQICFSKNPVRYAIVTDTPVSTPGLLIEVELHYRPFGGSTPTRPIIRVPLIPDSNGRTSVDFSTILDSLVSVQLPDFKVRVANAFEQVGIFFIEYREVTAAIPNPPFISDEAKLKYVLKGGLPYERWKGPNFFINFDFAHKNWLSWQAPRKVVAPWEDVWVSYFHLSDKVDYGNVRIRITYTDGTFNETIRLAFPDTTSLIFNPLELNTVRENRQSIPMYGLYRIPAGMQQLRLDDLAPNKKIHYYELQVCADAIPLVPPFTMVVDYTNNYNRNQLNYFNSLGGFDSVRIEADVTAEVERSATFSEIYPDAYYFNETNLLPKEFTQQVLEKVVYKSNIGYFDDVRRVDILRDLLLSKNVYSPKFSRWWPVNILTKGATIGGQKEQLRDFPIEYTYGFTNESYAPDFVSLDGLPICPIPTGFKVVKKSNGDWEFTWDAIAGAVGFELHLSPKLLSVVSGKIVHYVEGTSKVITPAPAWNVVGGYATLKTKCGFNDSASGVKIEFPK